MKRVGVLGNLLIGAALGGLGAAGVNVLADKLDRTNNFQLQGYEITWNSGNGPNYPLKESDKITCYADTITETKDPEGKTIVLLEGGSKGLPEENDPTTGLPEYVGPQWYFDGHTPTSNITRGQYADAKAVSGVEEANDFKPFPGIQEGASMFPFAIDSSRIVEIAASSPDMLGNLNSRK